jgi:uncharacterized protein
MALIDEFATAFATALEGGDGDTMLGYLAPGAVIWHNNDRQEVDAPVVMQGLGLLAQLVQDTKLDVILLESMPSGFVMQFALRGTVASNGKPFEMHNCVVVTAVDGKVTRMDEYVDPTVAAQLS